MNDRKLYYGDNLKILREYIADESVDLIYLDPPFNSHRNYNVLFKDESGQESESQLTAFEDTWHWDMAAESTYHELITQSTPEVSSMISALREFIGANQMMAYLVMMTARLLELYRVLKPTGSVYLHCDPTASHYLRIILDMVWGGDQFINEIIWRRYGVHNDVGQGSTHYGRVHDVILFYSKQKHQRWNQVFTPLSHEYIANTYRHVEPGTERRFMTTPLTGPGGEAKGNPVYEWNGHTRAWRYNKIRMQQLHDEHKLYYSKTGYARQKKYLDESKGVPVQDIWDDIPSLSGAHAERLGYPTQKPVALLERILEASSHEGDLVLDPFCGCGTTIHAAQKLKRNWIGIDITHLAIALQKYRLKDAFNILEGSDYQVIGEPESLSSAKQLAQDDRYQFQWWALSLIQAQPLGGDVGGKKGKKGKDKGIDGIIPFIDDAKAKPKRLIVQVKSGKVKSGDIRDLVGTIEREKAAIGAFITLESPTKDMKSEAASAGFYHSPNWNKDYPRIQILTIEDLLSGAEVRMPPTARTYKKAQRERQQQGEQQQLL